MDRAIPLLLVTALVVGWNFFLYKQSRGRMWNPLWIAFSTTALAIVYVGAGAIGYTLDRHERFVAHTAWTGHVIWSEIGLGLLAGLVALHFWHKGLQRTRSAGHQPSARERGWPSARTD
jgi:drug/metabolite transporter (DMT)-like permease